jgi:hypothetical protein
LRRRHLPGRRKQSKKGWMSMDARMMYISKSGIRLNLTRGVFNVSASGAFFCYEKAALGMGIMVMIICAGCDDFSWRDMNYIEANCEYCEGNVCPISYSDYLRISNEQTQQTTSLARGSE